jgi:hypothetical protein
MEQEYKIEALKESFDGERTDVFTKHIMSTEENLKTQVEVFVRYHSAERFNVWLKVKI